MVKKAKGKHRLDKFYRLAKEQGYAAIKMSSVLITGCPELLFCPMPCCSVTFLTSEEEEEELGDGHWYSTVEPPLLLALTLQVMLKIVH